ncbi:MAG: hypothetical protein Q9183_003937, partial [Haloplaca sp. 2 TL-2023]
YIFVSIWQRRLERLPNANVAHAGVWANADTQGIEDLDVVGRPFQKANGESLVEVSGVIVAELENGGEVLLASTQTVDLFANPRPVQIVVMT